MLPAVTPDNPTDAAARPPVDRRRDRLIVVLDILTLVAACLTLSVWATGGFREWTPLGRLSVTTWIRPLVAMVALSGVRHWLQPSPPLPLWVWRKVRAFFAAPDTRTVLPIHLATRVGVFVVGYLSFGLFGFRSDIDIPWRLYQNEILNLPARFDTGWYIEVATEGYKWWAIHPELQQNIAFFPAFPMLMRYVSLLFGREVMWTGVLISWVCFFIALIYLFRFTRDRFGGEAATGAVALLACYPFALFYSTAYTESLFLLTVVAACYHFEREQWLRAGIWGLAAGLTRPNGCLLSVVLGLLAIRPLWRQGWLPQLPPPVGWRGLLGRLAVAAQPGIGMLMFSTFIYTLTGHPFQWMAQNAAWGRVFKGMDALFGDRARIIREGGMYVYTTVYTIDAMQLAAVIFIMATVWGVYRRLGLAYAAMLVINIVPPVFMGGMLSMGRVTSVLFPTFVWLGLAVPIAHRTAWIAVFAMLQAICAALFFTWRPLF